MLDSNSRIALNAAKRLARTTRGVTGVDFGFTYVNGEMTDQPGVRFHVERKVSLAEMSASVMLPQTIKDVRVDVVEGSYSLHAGDPRAQQSTLAPGLSIGNLVTSETGTLGMFVRGVDPTVAYILSNWHVLAGGAEAKSGDEITQPGPMHLGSDPARPVATLDRTLALEEQFDAALARMIDGIPVDQTLFNMALTPIRTAEPVLGAALVKSGAVSGITHGIIDGIEGVYQLDYSNFGYGSLWMQGFRVIRGSGTNTRTVSEAGDSGAIWVDEETCTAVGLHFAGEDGGSPLKEYALAHSIEAVLERLGVVLEVTN